MRSIAPASISHFTSSRGKQFCNDIHIIINKVQVQSSSIKGKSSILNHNNNQVLWLRPLMTDSPDIGQMPATNTFKTLNISC